MKAISEGQPAQEGIAAHELEETNQKGGRGRERNELAILGTSGLVQLKPTAH